MINQKNFMRVQKMISEYLEKNPSPDVADEYPELDENEYHLDDDA